MHTSDYLLEALRSPRAALVAARALGADQREPLEMPIDPYAIQSHISRAVVGTGRRPSPPPAKDFVRTPKGAPRAGRCALCGDATEVRKVVHRCLCVGPAAAKQEPREYNACGACRAKVADVIGFVRAGEGPGAMHAAVVVKQADGTCRLLGPSLWELRVERAGKRGAPPAVGFPGGEVLAPWRGAVAVLRRAPGPGPSGAREAVLNYEAAVARALACTGVALLEGAVTMSDAEAAAFLAAQLGAAKTALEAALLASCPGP